MSESIHLIALGNVPAVPLSEVQAGDTLLWNFGSKSEVVRITAVTPKTYEIVERVKGQEYTRRKRGSTLVARINR